MSLTYRCISSAPTTTPSSRTARALTIKCAEGPDSRRAATIVPLSFPVFTVKFELGSQVGYLEFLLFDHPAFG